MATITEAVTQIDSLHQRYDRRWQLGAHSYNTQEIEQRDLQIRDLHTIEHGLCEQDLRVLFKILRKDYEDCGRKRGAILRYIKHYKEVADEAKPKLSLSKLHRNLTRSSL